MRISTFKMADSPAARLSHAYLDDNDNRRPSGRNMTMVMAMSTPGLKGWG
jgi:hypothetical protein